MSKRIAIFAPNSGIWIHAFPEAILAESLKNNGNIIDYYYCNGIFSNFCSVMSSYGLDFHDDAIKKNAACKKCLELNSVIKHNFDFNYKNIKSYLDDQDLKEIENILSSINQENFLDFSYQDIPVGKISLYQMLLNLKKNSVNFSELEWRYYLIEFKNSLISLFCAEKVLKISNPNVIIAYNSLYSVNNIWRHLAKKTGVDFYFLHAGGNLAHRLQTLVFAKDSTFEHYKKLVKNWPVFKNTPCSPTDLKKVYEHVNELLIGQHFYAYSSPVKSTQFDLYNFFKIDHSQKVFLACLSSNDERFAAELIGINLFDDYGLYKNQIIWLVDLIDYFKTRPKFTLIIRVHPREFPNKRETLLSDHAKELKELFQSLPENIKVNWPTDNISIYQLATQIDVALTSWSSVGKELSLFGLPVITYCPNTLIYSPDLNYSTNTREDYFKLLETCLEKRFCIERVRRAFRWYAYEYHISTFDISENFDRHERVEKSIFKRIILKIYRKFFPYYREKFEAKKRSKILRSSSQINAIVDLSLDSKLDLFSKEDFSSGNIELETKNITFYLKEINKLLFNTSHESF